MLNDAPYLNTRRQSTDSIEEFEPTKGDGNGIAVPSKVQHVKRQVGTRLELNRTENPVSHVGRCRHDRLRNPDITHLTADAISDQHREVVRVEVSGLVFGRHPKYFMQLEHRICHHRNHTSIRRVGCADNGHQIVKRLNVYDSWRNRFHTTSITGQAVR